MFDRLYRKKIFRRLLLLNSLSERLMLIEFEYNKQTKKSRKWWLDRVKDSVYFWP